GTVAFGHSMIRWADARFAHRFAGGPPPPRPPRYGAAKVAYEWREWGKIPLRTTLFPPRAPEATDVRG
ncbi:MAG: hypothetical protein QOI36_1742, partial [Pseudonocardiales bacterium]|nr:hypothetical protein [Pseudonocardiales bacterium]